MLHTGRIPMAQGQAADSPTNPISLLIIGLLVQGTAILQDTASLYWAPLV